MINIYNLIIPYNRNLNYDNKLYFIMLKILIGK